MKEFVTLRCPMCNRTYPAGFWRKILSWSRDVIGFVMCSRGGAPRDPTHGFQVVREIRRSGELELSTYRLLREAFKRAYVLWRTTGLIRFEDLKIWESEVPKVDVGPFDFVRVSYLPGRGTFRPLKGEYRGASVAGPLSSPVSSKIKGVDI